MGRQRDLNRSRERILASATKEFAAKGFAGARTRSIARRARINEQMIFHCFGSKAGLYRSVLDKDLRHSRARTLKSSGRVGVHRTCVSMVRLARNGRRTDFWWRKAYAFENVVKCGHSSRPETEIARFSGVFSQAVPADL